MKNLLAFAVLTLLSVPALAQSDLNLSVQSVSMDAGTVGNLNVLGTCTGPGCGLQNPYTGNFVDLGTFVGDGGSVSGLAVTGSGLVVNIPATSLTLKGNPTATGSVGVITDSVVTQTGGQILSVRTGGVEKLNVDQTGNINLTTGSSLNVTTGSTTLLLQGNAAAAGIGVNVSGGGTVAATGIIAQFTAAGTDEFHISARGHLCPISTAPGTPLAANFATGYKGSGAVNTISMSGSDASMILRFTTGPASTTQITETTSLIGTITLNQGYSNANGWTCSATYASPPTSASLTYGVQDEAPLACVPTGVNTFTLYPIIPFTPAATTAYAISITTMGAGSTY